LSNEELNGLEVVGEHREEKEAMKLELKESLWSKGAKNKGVGT